MEKLADVLGVEPEEIDDFAPSFRPRRRAPDPSADDAGPGNQAGPGGTGAR